MLSCSVFAVSRRKVRELLFNFSKIKQMPGMKPISLIVVNIILPCLTEKTLFNSDHEDNPLQFTFFDVCNTLSVSSPQPLTSSVLNCVMTDLISSS
jgi:hypothetical protein